MKTLIAFLMLTTVAMAEPGVIVFFDAPEPAKVAAPVRAGYPVRAGHWTGIFNKEQGIKHMTTGDHQNKFSRSYLEGLSFNELRSLHDDDHEGRVHWQFVIRPTIKTAPKPQFFYAAPQYESGCPGGVCPTQRRRR